MSGIKQDVVVLSAAQYNMVDGSTGENIKGTTVRYALTDRLVPYQEDNLKGYKLAKASLTFDDFSKFGEVPGIYGCDLNFNVGSDGVTKIRATNFQFKKSLFPQTAPANTKKAGE